MRDLIRTDFGVETEVGLLEDEMKVSVLIAAVGVVGLVEAVRLKHYDLSYDEDEIDGLLCYDVSNSVKDVSVLPENKEVQEEAKNKTTVLKTPPKQTQLADGVVAMEEPACLKKDLLDFDIDEIDDMSYYKASGSSSTFGQVVTLEPHDVHKPVEQPTQLEVVGEEPKLELESKQELQSSKSPVSQSQMFIGRDELVNFESDDEEQHQQQVSHCPLLSTEQVRCKSKEPTKNDQSEWLDNNDSVENEESSSESFGEQGEEDEMLIFLQNAEAEKKKALVADENTAIQKAETWKKWRAELSAKLLERRREKLQQDESDSEKDCAMVQVRPEFDLNRSGNIFKKKPKPVVQPKDVIEFQSIPKAEGSQEVIVSTNKRSIVSRILSCSLPFSLLF